MRLLDDLYGRRIRRQHPGGNLEALSGRISDTNHAVSALGFADNLKLEAVEGMERIENTNLLGFCTQGIVSVVTFIPTFTASFLEAESLLTRNAGFTRNTRSYCPSKLSPKCFVGSSSPDSAALITKTD
jgi:hypothetical protein